VAERTPDGRYIVVDGRRWRASDPSLPEERRHELVGELMSARRAVGAAKRAGSEEDARAGRRRVHLAKVALGERGPKWWETAPKGADGAVADQTGPASSRQAN
jgi:hypothetical protein